MWTSQSRSNRRQRHVRALAVICACILTGLVTPVEVVAQPTTAFVDVAVIPLDTERVVEHQTVVVTNGRIASMGLTRSTAVPAGAVTVDGRGKFLIPGLGDAHAHLSTVGGGPALAERAMQLYALNGVTMVRSMYTEPHHRGVRERVERGEILGPRSMIVSPALHGGSAQTPQAARDSIRKYKAEGYTLIKVLPGIARATFDTIVAEARAAQLALAGHVPITVPLQAVLDARFASIEHLDGLLEALIRRDAGTSANATGFFGFGLLDVIDENGIPAIVAAVRQSGTTIVPTEFEMELFASPDSGAAHARRDEMRYVPTALLAQWTRQKDGFARGNGVTAERALRYRTIRRRLIKELHLAGVSIAMGSDAFNQFDVAGFGAFDELATLVGSGLSPYDALRAATVNVAKLMGMPNVSGTIAQGATADLVLLNANPLADIANVRKQHGVMLRGVWYDRAELDRRLTALLVQ